MSLKDIILYVCSRGNNIQPFVTAVNEPCYSFLLIIPFVYYYDLWKPGESLKDFYKRTNMYWQMAAYEHTQHTGKVSFCCLNSSISQLLYHISGSECCNPAHLMAGAPERWFRSCGNSIQGTETNTRWGNCCVALYYYLVWKQRISSSVVYLDSLLCIMFSWPYWRLNRRRRKRPVDLLVLIPRGTPRKASRRAQEDSFGFSPVF